MGSIGVAAGVAISVIIAGAIAIHIVAVVFTEVLDFLSILIRGNVGNVTPMTCDEKDKNAPCEVECVVATCDNAQLDKSHQSVRFLSLPVNDDDLEALAELSHLKWLVLDNTNVSDTGLTLLHGLMKLRRLYVRGAQVTPDGIQRLRTAMPQVEVFY